MVKSGLSSSGSRFRNGLDFLLSASGNIVHSGNHSIHYLVESADWAVKTEALTLKKYIPDIHITSSAFGIRKKLLHFGTSSLFSARPARENRSVLTYYHIAPQDSFQYQVGRASQQVKIVHTSCEITKKKLIDLGVAEEKIIKIHIPVDLDIFRKFGIEKRRDLKQKMHIPEKAVVVGTFQKDGIGWGKGDQPKLEKGPDVFCSVVEKLSKKYPIFVLLTGPARGFVKSRLSDAGIPFIHLVADSYSQMVDFYNVLDLYLVTSRQEGGPKAILESMATGVPIVSTVVGQAPEIITSGTNGFLSDVEDVNALVSCSKKIIDNSDLKGKLISSGLATAKNYSAEKISRQFYNQVYFPLL